MSDPTTTNDIDALQAQLMKAREDEGWFITGDQAKDFSRALTALVAERDALWKERDELLKENVALRDRLKAKQNEVLDRGFEMDALRKRLAELEALSKPVYFAHGQRLESIDLRERLLESVLGNVDVGGLRRIEVELMGKMAVWTVDAAIAEMRKKGGGA